MRSLRSTLATSGLAVSLFLVALSLGGSAWLADGILERQFDRGLLERANGLATLLEQVGERVELHFADEILPAYAAREDPEYFQVWIGERVLERSISLHVSDPPSDLPLLGAHGQEIRDLLLPDGRAGRAIGIVSPVHHYESDPASGADPGPAVARVVVAVASADLDEAIRSLHLYAVGLGIALALLGVLLGTRVLAHGLRPLERWTSELERAGARHESSQAAAALDLPSELRPVARRIHALTASLQSALERERRTTASIAHELRTPIAELRAITDVALQTPGDAASAADTIQECRAIALDMQAMVTTLLSIARARAAHAELARQPVDIGELVTGLWRTCEPRARERGLAWGLQVDPRVPIVEVNENALGAILTNLLDNACSHTPPGGRVECRVLSEECLVRVVVENRPAGLAPDDLARFGEPFWRADEARSDRDHFGLGLALARECATAAAIELGFEVEAGCLRAIVTIPRGPHA